MNFGPQTT